MRTRDEASRTLPSKLPDEEELLRRARSLVPSLRARSLEIARSRNLPLSVMQELRDLGLMELARPARYGGPDLGMDVIFRIGAALAAGDGSTAWVYCVTNSHDHLLGLYPKEIQDEYWASSQPLSASSYMPTGKAVPAPGGYRLSGKWSFSSGIEFCDWVVVGAITGMIPSAPPIPDIRLFILRKSEVTVLDDWHVMGLSGTGSRSVVLNDHLVPEMQTLRNVDVVNGTTPGAKLHDNPMYRLSIWPLFGFSILAPATGLARGAFEHVVDEIRRKAHASASDPASDAKRLTAQMHLAEVGALIDAAELLYERGLRETFGLVRAEKPLSLELRVRNRRDQAYVAGLCRKAVDILMGISGGSGIREEGLVQRAFRDLYALSAHPGGNWDSASASYGSVLLGGPATEMFH